MKVPSREYIVEIEPNNASTLDLRLYMSIDKGYLRPEITWKTPSQYTEPTQELRYQLILTFNGCAYCDLPGDYYSDNVKTNSNENVSEYIYKC